jgi:2-polyprenyl-6-methoxyphenol hydroxylase-like FAD-dependent oxidoreductase
MTSSGGDAYNGCMKINCTHQTHTTRALVIGGSIAGLLAARVLAERFDIVTIVERDHPPAEPASRPGVPQATHQHVLLLRGLHLIERWFPGIRADLEARGAPSLDMAADMAWLTAAGWGVRFPSDLRMLTCSRDLLEWALRRRLATLDRIRFIEGGEACGLILEEDAIAGVCIRRRNDSAAAHEERAQLVVEASGRHSNLPKWLQDIGYGPVPERVVDGRLGYASRVYRVAAVTDRSWQGAYVQPAPPAHLRGGVILPIEGHRWHVTLAGMGGDYPPTDEDGFLTFAQSLRSQVIYEAIRDAQPLTRISGFRTTNNRWRAYESLSRWPDGLVVLGDAACAFNPVYAQGMTTAALGAEALETLLADLSPGKGRTELAGLGYRFQRQLARINLAPWQMATSEDLRLPKTTGAKATVGVRIMQRYIDRVVQATTVRQDVRLAFLRTMHMLDAPRALFSPRIMVSVIRGCLAKGRGSISGGRARRGPRTAEAA